MKAWTPKLVADSVQLQLSEVEKPNAGPGELCVRVEAFGLNRAELKLPAVPGSAAAAPGLEAAGVVESVGEGVFEFKAGDRVMGLCSSSHAEYAVMNQKRAMRVQDGMSWMVAASIPLSLLTAYDAIKSAAIGPGSVVYVNAASSGVGVMTWKIAQAMGAKAVIGSTSSPDKIVALRDAGLRYPVIAQSEKIAAIANERSAGKGVDVIIDFVGGPTISDHLSLAAVSCRWISVGRLGGLRGEIDLDLLSYKRLSLIGATFRTRSNDDVKKLIEGAQRDILPKLEAGEIDYPIAKKFAFSDILAAREAMRTNTHVGKIVVTM